MIKELKKWFVVIVGCLGVMVFISSYNLAEGKDPDYPTKTINFIIPYSPGGATDVTSRVLIEVAKKYLGQPIVPINKGGAGGSIGTMAVMTSKPDGYTIGSAVPSSAFVVPFSEEAPFKDLSGLTFIMNYGDYVYPAAIRSDSPFKTWKELIDWGKKNPGDIKIGLTAAKKSSAQGFVFRQIEQKEKVKFTYIPFKGGGDAMNALLGGHITLFASSTDASTVSLLEAGKIRVLTYMSSYKITGFENAPTTIELYGIETPSVLGVWGPKGLPEVIVKKLCDAFSIAVKDPDFIKIMKAMNMPIVYMDSKEMTRFIESTFQKTKETLKKLEAEEEIKERK